MRNVNGIGKRTLSLLMALVMIFAVIPVNLLVIAEEDTLESVLGSTVRVVNDVLYMYREAGSYARGCDKAELPEMMIITDVVVKPWGSSTKTYYKLATVDGSSHSVLDTHSWTEDYNVEIIAPPAPPVTDEGYVEGQVGLVVDGKEISELVIAKGEKNFVFTDLGKDIDGTPSYRWQLLIDKENNRWADIMDYIYPYAAVSEALLANAGIDGDAAVLRCIATYNEVSYVSGELLLSVDKSETPAELPVVIKPTTAPSASVPAGKFARSGVSTAAYEAFQIEVNYVYWNASELAKDIHGEKAAETFTVTLLPDVAYDGQKKHPAVPGYLAYVRDDVNGTREYSALEDKNDPDSLETHKYSLAEPIVFQNETQGRTVMVYYLPIEVSFTVNHYMQNLLDDEYTLVQTDFEYGFSDYPVDPDGKTLYLTESEYSDLVGFTELFYDPNTRISANGNTQVDIYYDRNYYLVDFDLSSSDGGEGYGVMPLYVRYGTQLVLGTPTNPGYTFDGWTLTNVYNRTETEVDGKIEISKEEINDADVRALYANPTALLTIKHCVSYKAVWKVATTSYTVIYWIENADDDKFTMAGFKTINAKPGDVVSATDDMVRDDKAYFTFNATLSDKNVTVKGDGTTAVNAYYLRRYYTLTFSSSGRECLTDEHVHDATCPTGTCSLESHTHTDECGVAVPCVKEEHKHSSECCTVTYHKHGEGDCVCGVLEHVHDEKCYTCQEHTHGNSCYTHDLQCYASKTGAQAATGDNLTYANRIANPVNGNVYRYQYSNKNCIILLRANNNWYYLGSITNNNKQINNTNRQNYYGVSFGNLAYPDGNGSYRSVTANFVNGHNNGNANCFTCTEEVHTHGDGNCTYKDDEHTHGEGSCPCKVVEHDHTSGCIYCTKEQHTHTPNCQTYACGKTAHTHGGDCVRECQIPEHTHGSCGTRFQVVTRKYGASISDVWQEVWGARDHTEGIRWSPSGSKIYTQVLVYFPFMPPENITLSSNSGGSKNFTMHYMLESLNSNGNLDDTSNYTELAEVEAKYGYLTKAEDFFDIVGFTQYKSSPAFGSNNQMSTAGDVYLYYERKECSLTFMSNGLALTSLTATLMYEQSIGSQYEPNDVPYPTNKEANAVKFAGWYTTENCADGTEFFFDGSTTMPLEGLILYAKWQPTTWNVKVYQEEITAENPDPELLLDETVLFDTMITEKEPKRKAPEEGYLFAGWYYMDGETEKRFDFNTMSIKKDYVIYAKWTSEVPVPYTVRYITIKDGEEIKIADDTEGVSLAGISKSFTAKVDKELYDGYQTRYFPTMREQTVKMESGENVITFTYVTNVTIEYRIKHVFTSPKFEDIIGQTTLELLWEEQATVEDSALLTISFRGLVTKDEITKKLTTGENAGKYTTAQINSIWEVIIDLSPDAFRKRLILQANSTIDQNEVMFHWSARQDKVIYEVHHYFESLSYTSEVDKYELRSIQSYEVYYDKDNPPTAKYQLMSVKGYYDEERADEVDVKTNTGYFVVVKPSTETDGLIISIYYHREVYEYTVFYYDKDTNSPISGVDQSTKTGKYGDEISISKVAETIAGYMLTNGDATVDLQFDQQAIICYYVKQSVKYEYDTMGNGGGLNRYDEEVLFGTEPKGSGVILVPGYVLDGWYYKDGAGELQKVTAEQATVNADGSIKPVIPTIDDVGQTIYFYAVLVPTSLTIKNLLNTGGINPNPALDIVDQGFIYRIQGVSSTATAGVDVRVAVISWGGDGQTILGLPVGDYTVTLESAWSWRYTAEPSVTLGSSTQTPSTVADKNFVWTFTFDGTEIMNFSYLIPGPDVAGTTEETNSYYITDNAYNTQN